MTRFVASRREKLWLSRRNGAVAPWNLRISDLQVAKLSNENARSAGLGLTVAALRQAFGRDSGPIFATGEILLPSGPGALSVSVGPVSGVRGKLSLVGDYIAQHRQALEGQKVIVVLPATAVDGRALKDAEASILDRLRQEAASARVQLDLVFAATLDDLEPTLGPFALTEIVTPKRALGLTAGVLVLAALFAGWYSVAHAPIALDFVSPLVAGAPSSNADEAAPQRARYDAASDKLQLLAPCFDAQREPLIVGGETLILGVRARDGIPFASSLRPVRLFIASVSRAADPILLDAAHFRYVGASPSAEASSVMRAAIPIEPVQDEIRLFVIATRDPNLEVTRLQAELRKMLEGLSGAAVLTTTTSFLADRVGTEIGYQFKVTNDRHACPD